MRHEHLVVTVEAETKARVDEALGDGESLEAWVADAIERKLADESDGEATAERGPDAAAERAGGSPEERAESATGRSDAERADYRGGTGASDPNDASEPAPDDSTDNDGYDEGFEYVDDCAI